MHNIREALAEGSASLAAAGIESPSLDASLLLAQALKISRSALLAAGPQPLTDSALADFHGLIRRRLGGECVAYILGRKEFYGLDFQVNPSVLVPRPETETLVATTLDVTKATHKDAKAQSTKKKPNQPLCLRASVPPCEQIPKNSIRVLDLCTGSGAVAIALKHAMPQLEVWATDISAEALETAKTNAAHLLPPDSIRFFHGDLFESPFPVPCSPFPVIVTNPPYIPTADIPSLSPEVRGEPALALDGGSDGLHIIRRIIAAAPEYLCPGGILLLEADPRQMQKIVALLEENGFLDIRIYRDLSGSERVIAGEKSMETSNG